MAPVICAEKLTHIYSEGTPFERTALANVDFYAEKGEFLGVIGHTGSGKSTLIQHLNGLLKPSSGRILLEGGDIWRDKAATLEARFKVGLVFQYPEYQLFEESVYRDIAFGPKNMGLPDDEIRERVYQSAEFVGLPEELLEKSPFELSGGQKRRAAIAGVIAMRPSVLILDEPTAGLDPAGRDAILENIRSYHRSTGSAVIMVSHSMEEIASTVDRLVVMSSGSVVMNGTPDEIFSRAEELSELGLATPQVTQIFMRLREMGLEADCPVYTMEQAVGAVKRLKGAGRRA